MAGAIIEILVTPLTELANLCISPLKKQVGYVVKYHSNLTNLRAETQEIKDKIDFLRSAIDETRRRGEAVIRGIENCLDNVEKTVCNVQHFLDNDDCEQGEKRDSNIDCTNLRKRYVVSKRAVKFIKVIVHLKSDIQQHYQVPVHQLAPPPSFKVMPTGDFEEFGTCRVVMDSIIAALADDNNSVIGVYGMGGVGKTSLVKEVAKLANGRNMFDDFVIVTVTKNPVKKIQREIAECLGMHLGEKNEYMRLLRLAERLKLGRRTLIILDDVWERIEFSQIGIPFGEDKFKCKIVLTTRNPDLCSEMHCSVSIGMNALSQQESWKLFKKAAGEIAESSDLKEVAEQVVGECGGLPIALLTVGRVLRNKERRMWEDAIYELRQSRPVNIKGMHEKVFACLKLSYDQFQNEESKLCYLYCSLFPEDDDIEIESLLRYGLGEGLFSDVETVDEARNRVHSIVSNLKASCLLLNGTQTDSAKMHAIYRALAISIATSDDYCFMVNAGSGMKDWPRNPKLEYVMRMSLIHNDFKMFCGQKLCPELLLLLLQNNTTLQTITDDFFAGMTALKVLDLSNIPNMVTLPQSLSFLTSLRTLCVENNNLNDGSPLGCLISLEILSLRNSTFERFPEELKNLTSLRLLDMTDTQIDAIPAKVMPNLVHLEELYMGGSFDAWEIKQAGSEGMATLAEVFSLEGLTTLHIDIGKQDCLTEEINIRGRLKKFQVHVGDSSDRHATLDRTVCFHVPDHFLVPMSFSNWIKTLLQTTQQLSLLRCKDLKILEHFELDEFKSLKHLLIQQCAIQDCLSTILFEKFRSLQELQIVSCSEMVSTFLFSYTDQRKDVLPGLITMQIQDAPKLTCLWRGPTPPVCFRRLKNLKVESCLQIKTLFSFAIAEQLTELQQLEISNCDELEDLICETATQMSEDVTSRRQTINNTDAAIGTIQIRNFFPELLILKLMHLKSMRQITQPWFLVDFPALEHLTVLSCPVLKSLPFGSKSLQKILQLRAEREWFEELKLESGEARAFLQNRFTGMSSDNGS